MACSFCINHGISIHAPRVGSDCTGAGHELTIQISIHAPRVGSDERQRHKVAERVTFQSTLPVWGAT